MAKDMTSWGLYPKRPQKGLDCTWQSDIKAYWLNSRHDGVQLLPFGNGRSYGDSCLGVNGQVFNMSCMRKFIDVDWLNGVVIAEAGVTLSEIIELSIPKGWFLSVTPGTQYVTLGGAIANDVHGKNHHRRGTFGNFVISFGLLRFGEEEVTCSRNENYDLYAATIGGLGLTGVITWVKLQLMPVHNNLIDTKTVRFSNIKEFFTLSEKYDFLHEYSVAWIDCLSSGKHAGRGVFIVGDHSRYGFQEHVNHKKLSVPITPPLSLINNLSLRIFNELYWRCHPKSIESKRIDFEPFFYPLDKILHWNRIYGRKGFQQYQCVIPDSVAREVIPEILNVIERYRRGSFLAVLKRCGDIPSPGLLSFPMKGVSLALDFPNSAVVNKKLFPILDAIVDSCAGRLYPAKDAHWSGELFRRAYPKWTELEKYRDPTLNSSFWERVTK